MAVVYPSQGWWVGGGQTQTLGRQELPSSNYGGECKGDRSKVRGFSKMWSYFDESFVLCGEPGLFWMLLGWFSSFQFLHNTPHLSHTDGHRQMCTGGGG